MCLQKKLELKFCAPTIFSVGISMLFAGKLQLPVPTTFLTYDTAEQFHIMQGTV